MAVAYLVDMSRWLFDNYYGYYNIGWWSFRMSVNWKTLFVSDELLLLLLLISRSFGYWHEIVVQLNKILFLPWTHTSPYHIGDPYSPIRNISRAMRNEINSLSVATILRYCDMTIWRYDDMAIWRYDDMTIWRYDDMTIWRYGVMALSRYDDMINVRTTIEILCATIRAGSMCPIVIPRHDVGRPWGQGNAVMPYADL